MVVLKLYLGCFFIRCKFLKFRCVMVKWVILIFFNCVYEGERERERENVCVCVSVVFVFSKCFKW